MDIFIITLCNFLTISSRSMGFVSYRDTFSGHLFLDKSRHFLSESVVAGARRHIEKTLDFLPGMLLGVEEEDIILLYPWKFVESLWSDELWELVVLWVEYNHTRFVRRYCIPVQSVRTSPSPDTSPHLYRGSTYRLAY